MPMPSSLHSWRLTPAAAIRLQRRLAPRVILRAPAGPWRYMAGLDAAFSTDGAWCFAAVVLWDNTRRTVVEEHVARRRLRFPYVPGLLSFREAPALLAALRRLQQRPDVLFCDGQGLAHPRRFGIACHVGLLADLPSVGCAKSLLVGDHAAPGPRRGARAPLRWHGERIGTVLRTRDGVRPLFVSPGHRMDHATAVCLVLMCGAGYRLPEPVRRADQLSRRAAHPLISTAVSGCAIGR